MPSVLVVDDKEQNVYLLRALLAGHGYDVQTASNGAEALKQATRKVPDLTISDILMPVMDGFTLCRRWRQDAALKDVPFVFYTATYTEPKDEQLALSLGADRFIIKPAEPDQFLGAIAEVLEAHSHGRLRAPPRADVPETQYLRQYNEVLVHKLEEKLVQVEDANHTLVEKDAFNQAVLNAMAARVAVLGPRGEVVTVNEAWARAAGEPDMPALLRLRVGEDALTVLPEDPAAGAGLRAGLREVLAGRRGEHEVELPSAAAEAPRWFLVRIERIGAAGAAAVVGAFDITARKRAEEAAREGSRRKDEFLALLGHELRNPLAPIKTASDMLKLLGLGDPRAERARAIIDRQVAHLIHIVDDLLDVARIARGTLVLRHDPADWAEVVRAGTEDRRAEFEARGIALELAVPAAPLWVSGDPTRLTQVLANLLGNALKFTDRGGRVEVRLAGENGVCDLVVRDTGVGMTAQTLARIFEPFEQAQQDSARIAGGVGMGLALAKGLVELHGGAISAASAGPGRGAELRVRLPLTTAPAVRGAVATTPVVDGAHVLIIEDNRDAAESLRAFLEVTGCRVEVAHDGGAGLAAARAHPPEIILCDIGLPGAPDGYGVAAAVRADPALHVSRLIALTGYGQPEDRERARQAGFDAHLTKPAEAEELLALVAHAHARPS